MSNKEVRTAGKLDFGAQREALDVAPLAGSTALPIPFTKSVLRALACANEVWVSLHLSFLSFFFFLSLSSHQLIHWSLKSGVLSGCERKRVGRKGKLTGMALLTVVLYTQERIVYSVRHPSNNCSDSDTFSWKSSADLLAIPK